jgi:hypothetical protein
MEVYLSDHYTHYMIKKYVNEEGLLVFGLCIANVITLSLFMVNNL